MKVIEIYMINPQPLQRAFCCIPDVGRITTNRAVQGDTELASKENLVAFSCALEPAAISGEHEPPKKLG
jgi:hypothetical protein